MAKDLRTQPIRRGIAALTVAAASLLHACGGGGAQSAAASARAVDLAAIAERDLVAAVIDECHAPLRGHMDRVAAKLRCEGGAEVRLFAMLPDKLRVQGPDGNYLLLGDSVSRLGNNSATEATAAETARVRRFRTLLDAAAFGPLHRATGCRRLGPNEFELGQAAGPPYRLRLRERSLLPELLAGAPGEVRIVDYLRTPSTWIAKRLELEGLGACEVDFVFGDIDWANDFFAPPTGQKDESKQRMRIAAEARSPVPVLVEVKATRWVCIADPENWAARAAAYRPVHAELEKQKQLIAGFPIFWQQDGKAWIAAPFRQRSGQAALQAPQDWQIREVPAGRWLEVWPPSGSLDEKLATGERQLREAMQAQRLSAAGPILGQPYLRLEEGEPSSEKLAAPVVRVAVAVQ
ncbi:MAG TPA: hypothetical protein VF384_06240 [Planctomycetota bacterium]